MNTREKLIVLIMESVGGCARNWAEVIADHLLKNGIIVPPCKVGQTVYYPIRHTNKVIDLFVREIVYTGDKIQCYASYLAFTVDNIGKTVFLTREEAEKALAGRSRQ